MDPLGYCFRNWRVRTSWRDLGFPVTYRSQNVRRLFAECVHAAVDGLRPPNH